MGKVKALWEAEREKRYEELFKENRAIAETDEEAHDMAIELIEEEDAANGQFGVGA